MSVRPLPSRTAQALGTTLLAAACLAFVAGPPLAGFLGHAGELFSDTWWTALGGAMGAAAALCLAVQFAIAARLRLLDRMAGLDRLFRVHRIIGIKAAILVLLHPFVVFWPEAVKLEVPSPAQWPLLVGAAALVSLWALAGIARFRALAGLPFARWLPMHRLGAVSLAVLIGAHGLFVGKTPHFLALAPLAAAAFFLLARGLSRPLACGVAAVSPTGRDAVEVELTPETGAGLAFAPGQFALVTFLSPGLPVEEHPFTIASAPHERGLRFTIRCCGDFTARIGALAPGDRALVRGPYGRFSHLASGAMPGEPLLFVAAGVGITPMLSMLRHLAAAESGGPRRVTLLWSNRDADDAPHLAEIQGLSAALPGFSLRLHFSRVHGSRLDGTAMASLLSGAPKDSLAFLCGPAGFMAMAGRVLRREGFSRVHAEEFAL